MAEAGDGSGHTPLTPEWTPAPHASQSLPVAGRPTGRRSFICLAKVGASLQHAISREPRISFFCE